MASLRRVYAVTTLTPYVLRFTGERMRKGEITPSTAHSYQNHLRKLDEIFGNRRVEQLGRWLIDRWLEETRTIYRPSTRAARLITIRQFAAWLVDEEIVRKDFTRGAPKVRRPRQEPRDIQLEHFIATLNAVQTTREQIIVWLAYGMGLRCVEISRLMIDDWDTAVNELHIVGKALHERTVPVPSVMRPLLGEYVRDRASAGGPLIHHETRPGDRLSASRISNMVSRIIARTGLKARAYDGFSAHGLRAGGASDLLDACNDLRVVQKFLGHANLATTSIYTRRASKAQMRDALELRQWTKGDSAA